MCTVFPGELFKPPVPRTASNSGPEGDRVSDLCGTARLGEQVGSLEVWLHVQTTSCDNGRTIEFESSTGPRPVREETSVMWRRGVKSMDTLFS